MERVINIVDYHQQTNNGQTFYNKQAVNLRLCNHPWSRLVVNSHGDTYICASPAWLPKSIGSVLDYDSFFDLLNSYEARSIRSEVESNRYTYCNQEICSHLANDQARQKYNTVPSPGDQLLTEEQFTEHSTVTTLPHEICFDFDYTCNFRCPSCRIDMINHNHGPIADVNRKLVERIKNSIIDLYIQHDTPLTIRWAGGEPFLSHAYLDLWDYMSQQPSKIRNIIQTNGSYLSRRDDLLKRFLPYVKELRISFDAASAETYNKIRVNGVWEELLNNCRYIKELIDQLGCSTALVSDFVVQLDNYKEIPAYIELVKHLGFDKINLSRMWNWDTWDMDEFARLNISNSTHPQYLDLVNILDQYKQDKQVHVF